MELENKINVISELLSEVLNVKEGEDPVYMYFLENKQVNMGVDGESPTIKLLSGDKLRNSLERIINLYLMQEMKHWEESGKTNNHIYNDLLFIKNLIENGKEFNGSDV